jgi:hypothetical protein
MAQSMVDRAVARKAISALSGFVANARAAASFSPFVVP